MVNSYNNRKSMNHEVDEIKVMRSGSDFPARDFSSSKIESPHISNEKPGKDTHNSNLYISVIKDLMYAFVGFM